MFGPRGLSPALRDPALQPRCAIGPGRVCRSRFERLYRRACSPSCLQGGCDVTARTWADKRAHHNALERRRRDHIKFSFTSLRDAVPSLQGEKASRAQILKKAADYIQSMRLRALEKTKVAGGGGYSTGSMLDAMNIKGDSISAFDGGSGSESSDDTDNSSRGSRKKLKSSPGSTPLHL
ncbi:hypothetical protein HPB51_016893 [Rhipicephalus microplus]|uniref:BHLH domain-containing protein n=1 Tax=Rhipicephalus microplus TaxID=6941 RepID=A0A9J6E2G1_RHIMP|nr:hypothetical protein HPB51_016893 [Rhipicephalus microplus]